MTPELETANRVDDFGCQLTADINSCGMSGVKEWTTIGWDSSCAREGRTHTHRSGAAPRPLAHGGDRAAGGRKG